MKRPQQMKKNRNTWSPYNLFCREGFYSLWWQLVMLRNEYLFQISLSQLTFHSPSLANHLKYKIIMRLIKKNNNKGPGIIFSSSRCKETIKILLNKKQKSQESLGPVPLSYLGFSRETTVRPTITEYLKDRRMLGEVLTLCQGHPS